MTKGCRHLYPTSSVARMHFISQRLGRKIGRSSLQTEGLLPCCRVRLVSLAAQRFVASALHDAKQVYSRRQKQTPARLKEAGYDVKDRRPVLLTEDLAEAMLEVCTLW